MKDKNFREAAEHRHPDFEPYLVFNDIKGQGTIFFQSTLNTDPTALKLFRLRPDLYYWPENPETNIITVKQGEYARLPHSKYTVNSLDGSPCTYNIRSVDQM